MLTTQEIYNFLVNAEAAAPEAAPAPPNPTDLPPPPPMLPPIGPAGDDGHIESLRTRLQALIGPAVKKASAEEDAAQIDRVFGKKPGELDPEAEPLDPEWEEILRAVTGENLPEAEQEPAPATISLRSKRPI